MLLYSWILFTLIVPALGAYKQWIRSTNYDDAANWDLGRAPCSRDTVHFNEHMPESVFIQNDITITEMILPMNGNLVLGDGVSLSAITESSSDSSDDSHCTNASDITYSRDSALSWWDPANWCSTGSVGGACLSVQPALLHSEQVACQHDSITFPEDRGFLVDLEHGVDIQVAGIRLRGKDYDTSSFSEYLSSLAGRREFPANHKNQATVTIRDENCDDLTGCACNNDRPNVLPLICNQVSCPQPECENALLPIGGCCEECGSLLTLDVNPTSFRIQAFGGKIRSKFLNGQESVKSIVSKTHFHNLQVVLTDKGNGTLAAAVGEALKQALKEDISAGSHVYGVTTVDLKTSGRIEIITPAPVISKHRGSAKAAGIAIVAILIIVLVLVLALLMYRRREKIRSKLDVPVSMSRLKSSVGSSMTSTMSSVSEKMSSVGSTVERLGREGARSMERLGREGARSTKSMLSLVNMDRKKEATPGFENPTYGSPVSVPNSDSKSGAEKEPLPEMTEISLDGNDNSAGFCNPVYGQVGPIESVEDLHPVGSVDITDMMYTGYIGIANPLYGEEIGNVTNGKPDVPDYLVLNPAFSTDGVEQDSQL